MKHFRIKYLLLAVICFICGQQVQAQHIVVRVQPRAAVVARPVAPAPNYVWIEGEWIPKGRTYAYQPGYWMAPRTNYVWVPGHWMQARSGWYWIKGYWTRA